jgi:hypothetical protein
LLDITNAAAMHIHFVLSLFLGIAYRDKEYIHHTITNITIMNPF